MARPKEHATERVQMQFRISPELQLRLNAEADRRFVSKNLLIERALENALTEWEKEDLT